MGKKLGLGFIGLIIIGAIYYFTAGSEQITAQMKKQVNTELTSIQKEGFSVQEREVKESKEHFVLSFDEPQKIASFLSRQGVQLNVHDAELLKGTKIGVDVNYLPDTYAAVSFDIYPLSFPPMILSMAENDKEKEILLELIKKKTFLTHIAINKLGNGFKGDMKDIHEVLHGKQTVTLQMQGFTFSGDIKTQRISAVKEEVEKLLFLVDDDIAFTLTGIKSDYSHTGNTAYDYTTNYSIDNMQLHNKKSFELNAKKFTMHSVSVVQDKLVSGMVKSSIKHISTEEKGKKYAFDDFTFEMKATNLDVSAFEKLQHVNVNDEQAMNALLQTLISKGVQFEIPTLSIATIEAEGQKMDGFDLNAKVDIDKSLDVSSTQVNPMAALSAIDANFNVTLSAGLFGIIAQQPKAMMVLMLFPPKDVNGKKAYNLELKDGKLTVNGMGVN